MKRIAVIDLGTNTFHLLITAINQSIIPGNIYKETIVVKLGEDGINKGIIQPAAFLRGIKALEKFSELIKQHQVTQVKAMATAAIRNALNGEEFTLEVKIRTGIEIEIIDGNREADLIYKGVREAVKMNNKYHLMMDIGGGSVEFIICDHSQIFWKKSYPLGAAKLMERFHHSDPISIKDINQIVNQLKETLPELLVECSKYRLIKLIGSAGAFETFEELIRRRFEFEAKNKNVSAREIKLNHFQEIASVLLKSTHEERSKMPGLIALRVDMIVVATLLTQHIINELKIGKLIISDYSLKEGILFDLIGEILTKPVLTVPGKGDE
ncbi:MAG: exopolyphosphatase [Flavobacterium sp.]|nr:exopolyphosphatase [Pedobacter sp.]